MARLETQINQIYLTHPEAKKTSLILYEEALSNSHHLFVVAELHDLQKKSESTDLKKISEIILASFRANKRLSAEALFESSLAQINQNLADMAHEGRKSWVGKFSCLVTLKTGDNIYLANNGQTSAWLKRKSELLEILPAEKRGTHPLKTFQNFTQGKISDQDGLILMTSSIFNYVSFELFSGLLSAHNVAEATAEISKILQESAPSDQAFSAFLLEFGKKQPVPIAAVPPEPKEEIYAPLPEEIEPQAKSASILPNLPRIGIPKLKIPGFKFFGRGLHFPKIRWQFFQNLSPAGKFFFISFAVFLALFAVNLAIYGFRLHGRKSAEKIETTAQAVGQDIANVQSALIYKDESLAFKSLATARTDYDTLKRLSTTRADEFTAKIDQITAQVNKVSTVTDPKVYAEFKHHPVYLAKTNGGFLISAKDSNTLSLFNGTETKDYFMLNSLSKDIAGIAFWPATGPAIAVADKIYYIDQNLKQFETLLPFPNANISVMKSYNSSLFALDKNGQIIKVSFIKNKYSGTAYARGDYSQVRDFALDKDVYLLAADSIQKISGGQTQNFPLPFMTDQLTNASKIFVAGNLYILEPNKKRVVILSKSGALVNQIYFPTVGTLLDFYVDEAGRNLYLLDDNKLYRVTF